MGNWKDDVGCPRNMKYTHTHKNVLNLFLIQRKLKERKS